MTHALAPYPDPESRDRQIAALADGCGGELLTFGRSVQGRPLQAVRVPGAAVSLPRVLVTANIHGVEYISGQVALGILEALPHLPLLQRLRARAELWVVPCLNPDAYARTFEMHGHGTVAQLRTNAHGVDLNRNFPIPKGYVRRRYPGAGSTRPGSATYIGHAALSEPESAALDTLMTAQAFVAGINGHSFMGAVIPPRVLLRHHWKGYKELCRALRQEQKLCRYGRLASPILDTFTGELEDHQHHGHGMWAACLETFSLLASFRQHLRAPTLFWRFNPRDPAPWVQNDVPAVAAYLLAALDQPFLPLRSLSSAPPGFG